MATMNISLPDTMKSWVENQTVDGRYSNTSDYIRDLIRKDQERSDAIAAIQTAISEGMKVVLLKNLMSKLLNYA